ncbi:uncharacterized protein DNG_06768 [Cephalotrichum gorgonifer]|uniref:Uncharacterized protein n=1 Tax=Cephalotrichum gorgonifer TaxID=2041049 RepID=A0AAE8N0I2_9PEZI|nr:uncharacterized protein DNG_06768 [Cephalotrichum gorgonifer]
MDKFREGVRDLGDEPARQTEGAQQQGKSGMESAKQKTQGESKSNPMEKAKSAVEDKIQGLREEGQKFMGGDKGGSGR